MKRCSVVKKMLLMVIATLTLALLGCAPTPPKQIVSVSPDGMHINISKEGSLRVTHHISCIPIEQARTEYTPADLYPAVTDCILKGEYQNASELFVLASTYSYYDTFRVTDVSAHQAGQALIVKNITPLNSKYPDKMAAMSPYLDSVLMGNAATCAKLRSVGKPTYEPVYMAAHGLRSLTVPYQSLILSNFDTESAWSKALQRARCL